MTIRKLFFWLHLAAGLAAGLVILIMSVTGVVLMYERQIINWADRGFRVSPPSSDARRLPIDTMLARIRDAKGGLPTTIALSADRAAPATVTFGRSGPFYADPYTGRLLGEGSTGVRKFFGVILSWHRWLGQDGKSRAAARAITGACNLGFLFLVVSGFYLWWPRKWNLRYLRKVSLFRGSLRGKARDFNWHNAIGLWAAAPLFFIVLTGIVMSYPWANNLLNGASRSAPPAQARPAEQRIGLDLDAIWAIAERQLPGWRTIRLTLPKSSEATLSFAIDQGNGAQPQKRSQLTVDRSGQVVRWENFESFPLGPRLRALGRYLHTGELFGFAGQTVAGIVSSGAAVLVWTGLALSWRRLRAFTSRRRRESHAARYVPKSSEYRPRSSPSSSALPPEPASSRRLPVP